MYSYRRFRVVLFLMVAVLGRQSTAYAEHRLVSVGDHRLAMDCEGGPSPSTVVLIAGQGRTAQDWAQVQPAVSRFARVCSYDRAGSGESEKVIRTQSLDEQVEDLHQLLAATGEKTPYLLVGHSLGGIYCRRFARIYPNEVSGFAFLDSSHEEQLWRLHEIDPKGPVPTGVMAEFFYPEPGRRLDWKTDRPLIVLVRGKPDAPIPPLTTEQNAAFGRVWRDLQNDLARRSPKGQLRVAENSGHFIQLDEPASVIKAIRDLVQAR